MIFNTRDYTQTPVVLTENTWFRKILDPVFGHPEVKSFRRQLKSVVQNPNYVYQSVSDQRSKLFFKTITTGEFKNYYLCIVVKYIKEQTEPIGYTSTIMINRDLPKKGTKLWESKTSI